MQTLATVAVIIAAIATVAAIVLYLLRQHARAEVAALQGRVRVLEHDLARERATRQAIETRALADATAARKAIEAERATADARVDEERRTSGASAHVSALLAEGRDADALTEALRGVL
jgi:predicted Holliday junction resolvase-like endonuclease